MTLFNKISDNVWEIGVIPEDIALLRHQISENYPTATLIPIKEDRFESVEVSENDISCSTGGKKMIFNVSFLDEADEAWFVITAGDTINLPLTEIRLYEIEHRNFGWRNTDIGTRFSAYYDTKRPRCSNEAYNATRDEQLAWFRSNMAVR